MHSMKEIFKGNKVGNFVKALAGTALAVGMLLGVSGNTLTAQAAQFDFKTELDNVMSSVNLEMNVGSTMSVADILMSTNSVKFEHLNSCIYLQSASTTDTEYLQVDESGRDLRFTALKTTPSGVTVTVIFSATASCGDQSMDGSVVDYPISFKIVDPLNPTVPEPKDDPYMKYNYETIDAIRAAKGDNLTINAGEWVSFCKKVYEELALKPNLSLTVNYKFEDKNYTLTIPAGANLSEFSKYDHSGYRFVNTLFPGAEVK